MLKLQSQKSTGAYVLAVCVAASLAPLAAVPSAHAEANRDAMAKTGTRYDANADMQAVLDALAALNGKPIESLTPEEARKQPTPADAVMAVLKRQGKESRPEAMVPGVTSIDRDIPGAIGAIGARIYTPSGAGPFPVVVYFHGGGWVIANKVVYDGGARGISKQANAIVVSVDYRLAPDAKFPAAWDDAFAAYKWVASNASSINGDPKRLALAGESAGGNLAIATAVAVRDAQTGNLETRSYVDSATAKPLNKAMIGWFVDKLFANPAEKSDPRVDIVHANLSGLPPVTIINAQIDPLREDGTLLAKALKKAGVKVDHKLYRGVTHEFFGTAAVVKAAANSQLYAGKQLRFAFSTAN